MTTRFKYCIRTYLDRINNDSVSYNIRSLSTLMFAICNFIHDINTDIER